MKRKKQSIKLANENAPVPTGMSAFADVLSKEPTPKKEQATWLDPTRDCSLMWHGCTGDCSSHPNALGAAAMVNTDLRYGTLMTLLALSERRLDIFKALLENGNLREWWIKDLINRITNTSEMAAGRGAAEDRYMLVVQSERCGRSELLQLCSVIRLKRISEEGVLLLLEHPKCDDLVQAELALQLAYMLGEHGEKLREVIVTFGSENARACLALARIHKAEGAKELLKTSRRALARFTHCRGDALQMMETLTKEWSGTLEEFIEMTAMILGRKKK